MSDVTNGIFSDHCYNQMWELFKTPEDEVGSKVHRERWASRSVTNCIIYVSKVLIYAHSKIGRSDRNERIRQLGIRQQDGSKLANYLVREIGWNAHYWNPDTDFAGDNSEHLVSYKQVLSKSHYLPHSSNLPVSGVIVNYNKRDKTAKRVWVPTPVNVPNPVIPIPIPIPIPVTVPADNTAILGKLSQVKFAFGIARGGTPLFCFHTGKFLKSTGKKRARNYMVKFSLKIMSGCPAH